LIELYLKLKFYFICLDIDTFHVKHIKYID